MTQIKHKKKKCADCGKMTYGKRCNSCMNKQKAVKLKTKKRKPVAKKTKKSKRSFSIVTIRKHCFDVYSLFVRLRDSNSAGMGKCITCDRVCYFYDDNADNGHFFSRRHMSTAFHPENNNLQCKGCNGPGSGMQYDYGLAVDSKFGEGTAAKLKALSLMTRKYSFDEFLTLLKDSLKESRALLSGKKLPGNTTERIKERFSFYDRYIEKVTKILER